MFRFAIPVLHVSRSLAAEKFYCEKLGFTRRSANRTDEARDDPAYIGLERDGVWLHLSSFSGDGVVGGVVFLGVEDVDLVHAELLARGVRIDTGPVDQTWGNREMYVRDADGNSIRFVQDRRPTKEAPKGIAVGRAVFRFDEALPVLRRTPAVLRDLLRDLPSTWIEATEGPGTWSPLDVVGHLIHGERTDWVPRVEHMLRHGDSLPFLPFDREAMFAASRRVPLSDLLDTFSQLRSESLSRMAALGLTDADLARRGTHPELGAVTLAQHLATWVAHDLDHLGQVVRVMARRYSGDVGPWRAYLSILGTRS